MQFQNIASAKPQSTKISILEFVPHSSLVGKYGSFPIHDGLTIWVWNSTDAILGRGQLGNLPKIYRV